MNFRGKDANMNKSVIGTLDTSAQIDTIKTMGVSKKISSDTSVATMKQEDLPQINGVFSEPDNVKNEIKMQQTKTEIHVQPTCVKRGRGRPRGRAQPRGGRGGGRPRGRPPGSSVKNTTSSAPTTPIKTNSGSIYYSMIFVSNV